MAVKVAGLWSLAAYRTAARLLDAVPLGSASLRASLAGRRHAVDRWATWTGGPTIWFHAASVGEALTAEPIMRRLLAARPAFPLVLTHTSESLTRWPFSFPAARIDYAPAEDPGAMRRAFDSLQPVLLVFSRSDLWPEMLLAADDRAVPVAVVGGAVRPSSLRLRTPARRFLRPLYRPVRFVGAVSDDDARRWRQLGVTDEAIIVTGDPRHDQVLERPVRLGALRTIISQGHGPVLVAGSVEAADAGPLLEAYRLVRARRADARLVVVPHDPESDAAAPFRATPEVVVVNSLGVLADLYLLADIAYVGGGFSRRGTHATAEPATFGIPMLVPSAGLARQWLDWIEDPGAARNAGLAARRALLNGASRVSTDRLLALLFDRRLKD